MRPLSVLIVSTPVGPIGSGVGGGVELTLRTIADGLAARGHRVEVVAPTGSTHVGHVMHHIDGRLASSIQFVERTEPLPQLRGDDVLVRMWNLARTHASRHDIVVNLAYDAHPFEVSGSFPVPVAHLVSMASLTDAMDDVVNGALRAHPGRVAMHSHAQASTFVDGSRAVIVGSGVDVTRYEFRGSSHTDGRLGFVGRISAEKGLRDAFVVARSVGRPLHVWGFMQDPVLWDRLCEEVPDVDVHYGGFVSTHELQRGLGDCSALLVTSQWVEAFGNVVIEALACGVPVVTYDRGGPAEIVANGSTGFVVAPDDVGAMVGAVAKVGLLKRADCRARAEADFSTAAFVGRVEDWLSGVCRGADFPGIPLSF